MTLRSLYRLERRGLLTCRIIGVASEDWTTAKLVEHARDSIAEAGEKIEEKVFERFAKRLSYISGDVKDDALYTKLAQELGPDARTVYYLQMPPFLFGPIVEKLGAHDLVRDGSQLVIATHSPIVLAYPDAIIYECDVDGLHAIAYDEAEPVRLMTGFLADRRRYLTQLFGD